MRKLALISVMLCVFFVSNAQKVQNVDIWPYKYYSPNGVELVQTKNGLTIELIPISPNLESKFPELFSWKIEDMPQEWRSNLRLFYPQYPDASGKYYQFTFGAKDNLNVYKIKITNNTGHIIKMSDARIFLRVEGEDPIKPVTKIGNATLVPVGDKKTLLPQSAIDSDESLIHWSTVLFSEWDKTRKKGFLYVVFPLGLTSQVIAQNKKAYKLINDVNVEILPEDSYSGILLFPRLIKDDDISIRLYEFITKTDAAGNATEKSNFEFKLKLIDGKMWYDRNKKTFIDGEPPAQVEYYDKKSKSWIMGSPQK